jgi:hypothetical protein
MHMHLVLHAYVCSLAMTMLLLLLQLDAAAEDLLQEVVADEARYIFTGVLPRMQVHTTCVLVLPFA